jgi:hypothetical protein
MLDNQGGLGKRAVVVAHLVRLAGVVPDLPTALFEDFLALAAGLPADALPQQVAPPAVEGLPESFEAFAMQAETWLEQFPERHLEQCLRLDAVRVLWGAATKRERLFLRRTWRSMAYKPPVAEFISEDELRAWVAALPTIGENTDLKQDALAVLQAETAENAYHIIANHLLPDRPLLPIARTLTSLAGHLAQRSQDNDGFAFGAYRLGLALSDLAPTLQPSVITHGIVQLNHRIWQLRSRSRRAASTEDVTDLGTALRCGDASAAMQLARQAATAGTFWMVVYEDLQRFLTEAPADQALQAGAIVGALAMSTSPNLDPERAARVAGALADLTAGIQDS